MKTPAELERDRAVRIAYLHARAGRDDACTAWLELAHRFARPTPRQLEHARELLRRAGPVIHPGQLSLTPSAPSSATSE